MKLTELETILLSIEGQMSLGVFGSGRGRSYQVWYWKKDRDFRGSGPTLAAALDAAVRSGELEKKCSRCLKLRPVREFGKCRDKTDGRASHCLECDRQRKKKWYPRAQRRIKKAARAAQAREEARRSQLEN